MWLRRCANHLRRRARSVRQYGIDPNRARDVLELLLTEVSEFNTDLAADLIICRKRQTDAARLGHTLNSRCNIDAVSEQVVLFDEDVTDIYPDTKQDPLVLHFADGLPVHAVLELYGRSHRLYRAWKFGKEPVAGVLDDAAGLPGDRRHNRIRQQCGQAGVRRLLVLMHEARIAGN